MTDPRLFAVVTGGSSGIGLELARRFAGGGYDVLIAAEDPTELQRARAELTDGQATITTHAGDLSTEAGVDGLIAAIGGRAVDAAAINAGVGLGGRFVETDLKRELSMIDLNCRGAVQLAKHLAQSMVAKGSGRILFTSSVAATMPDPFEAVYGATKMFLRWFGQALREELKDTGVTVTLLMPSTTETNFFRRADMMDTKAGTMKKDDAGTVAKAGFDALMAGKDHVIPTAKNKLMGVIADSLPDPIAAKLHRGLSEPGTAEKGGGSSVAPLAIGAAALGAGAALFAYWRNGRSEGDVHRTPQPSGSLPGTEPLPAHVPTATEIRVGA
jgi:short-subunit dehydrogenase